MGRFEVGESVVFINFGKEFFMFPSTREMENNIPINLVEMKCVEHHKVPHSYQEDNGERNFDGYIFEINGWKWHNQFPRAQTSNWCDWRVSISDSDFESQIGNPMDMVCLLNYIDVLTHLVMKEDNVGYLLKIQVDKFYTRICREVEKQLQKRIVLNSGMVGRHEIYFNTIENIA